MAEGLSNLGISKSLLMSQAAVEKHVPPLLTAFQLQAEHVVIKPLRAGQVVDVEAGFQDAL